MERVLVAGATGALGQHVVAALKARGCRVRVLSRSAPRALSLGADEVVLGDATRPASIADACAGVERVFSCLGQSVAANLAIRGPGYHAVDYLGNHHLIEAAKRARVGRFVYVSVFGAEAYPANAYLRAHADVAAELRASGLRYAIIQPTGFFSAFGAFLAMARGGMATLFGSGTARSNPIHDADLAELCADTTLNATNEEILVGGPEVYTRREVIELAFAALGRQPRIVRAPAWAPGAIGAALHPFAPRIGELLAFFGVVSRNDFVAPPYGERRLGDYFRELTTTSR
ncbi:MAG: SDR family oxidoreductase [Chloroflexi bacterium OHK40]